MDINHHNQNHRSHRVGWLRAAVMGANDGIVSTSALLIGVAAAGSNQAGILLAGMAGLVAGAMSMAAGEYVSVSSQADTEKADVEMEARHLREAPEYERQELADIYVSRGLDDVLALEVADQLMAHDALGAHLRDELGMTGRARAQPIQAALASAATFTLGAALPVWVAWFAPLIYVVPAVAVSSLFCLAGLGILAAHVGGAPKTVAALRVTFWGTVAMLLTAGVGNLFERLGWF